MLYPAELQAHNNPAPKRVSLISPLLFFVKVKKGGTFILSNIPGDAVKTVSLLQRGRDFRLGRIVVPSRGRIVPAVQFPGIGHAGRGNVADVSFINISIQPFSPAGPVIGIKMVADGGIVPAMKRRRSRGLRRKKPELLKKGYR